MVMKASLENVTSRFCNFFAIIPMCLTWKMLAIYPGTKLQMNGIKVRKKKNRFAVMRSRSLENMKLVISSCCFAEDGKGMYQNVNARAERLFLLIKPTVMYVMFSLPLPSSLLKLSVGEFPRNSRVFRKLWRKLLKMF